MAIPLLVVGTAAGKAAAAAFLLVRRAAWPCLRLRGSGLLPLPWPLASASRRAV
jgi:hypothetical protein